MYMYVIVAYYVRHVRLSDANKRLLKLTHLSCGTDIRLGSVTPRVRHSQGPPLPG